MLTNSGLSSINYNKLLISWANQATNIKSNVPFGAGTIEYTTVSAQTAHNTLTSAPYNWNITDGGANIPCFIKGTYILTDKGYILIENLKKGMLIQTFKNGFVPLFLIGNKEIYNNHNIEFPLNRLYKYPNGSYLELFDDLIITGGHSILIDKFESEKQKMDNDNIFGCTTPLIDGKHCLLSCNDEKAVLYEKEGVFTIYHLALENNDEFGKYGIFANGLLTESCEIDFLKKNMDFV
jgi:hypothetical protein